MKTTARTSTKSLRSKREADLHRRLTDARNFIRGMMKRSENYGSTFSSEVFVDCESFLKHDGFLKDSNTMLIKKHRWTDLVQKFIDARTEIGRLRKKVS